MKIKIDNEGGAQVIGSGVGIRVIFQHTINRMMFKTLSYRLVVR